MKPCCPRCRAPLACAPTGRPRRYCGDACRQAACRRRKKRSVHFSSKTCEWATPPELFAELDAKYGPFTLDVAATAENAKCRHYFDRQQDGLKQRWSGRVWCNPPYGRPAGDFVRKAWESVQDGDCEVAVCLVASRTDTKWFHRYALRGELTFLEGRLKFGLAESGAPFPSVVVVFRDGPARHETATA